MDWAEELAAETLEEWKNYTAPRPHGRGKRRPPAYKFFAAVLRRVRSQTFVELRAAVEAAEKGRPR